MANRFPLIANSSTNQIQELAAGDNLDLTNSGISSVGNIYSVGVVTASSFYGNLTGTASTATTATALETSRTFEITGDVVASAISFDGSGNVSLAATIQPNSVGLGTDTVGEYVTNITGTSNQIEVTGGTGEGSTPTLSVPSQFTAPQDVTVTRDLQVNRDLNVNGNITIGGTAATLFTTEFKVFDPDIVLGFRTDGSGNDISTDNTANHGGIAIASTEGTPLISLYDVGVGETNPATYKKIMWFKSGTFSGLGTDAWISNYAIGIGSTQVPNGVRLSAGGMQVTDSTIAAPQLNISGIVTAGAGIVLGPTSNTIQLGTGTTISSPSSNTFTISTNGSERVRVDSSGRLAIGTTTVGYPLTVNGRISYNTAIGEGADITLSSVSTTLILGESSTWQNLSLRTGGSERARIDSSGNFGLGTSSPTDTNGFGQCIDIRSSTGAAIYLRDSDDTTNDTFVIGRDNSDSYLISNSGNILFFNAGSERARITSTGNFGIGETNPLTKLYVSGSAASNIVALGNVSTNTALDLGTGNNFSLTLTGSITLSNPSNLTVGQSGIILIQQDGSGSKTCAFGSYWDFPSGTAPTLSTGANALDCITYFVRSSTSIVANSLIGIGPL